MLATRLKHAVKSEGGIVDEASSVTVYGEWSALMLRNIDPDNG